MEAKRKVGYNMYLPVSVLAGTAHKSRGAAIIALVEM